MKEVTHQVNLINKTIIEFKFFDYNRGMVVFFNDDTYCIIKITEYVDASELRFVNKEVLSLYEQFNTGIISGDEYNKLKRLRKGKNYKMLVEEELAEFERLKEKYKR